MGEREGEEKSRLIREKTEIDKRKNKRKKNCHIKLKMCALKIGRENGRKRNREEDNRGTQYKRIKFYSRIH